MQNSCNPKPGYNNNNNNNRSKRAPCMSLNYCMDCETWMGLDKPNLARNSPSSVIPQIADWGTASIYEGICEYIEYAFTDSWKGIVFSLMLKIPHSKTLLCYKSFTNTWYSDWSFGMTYAVEKKFGIRYLEWWHWTSRDCGDTEKDIQVWEEQGKRGVEKAT